jgi:hypothetical protein
VLNVPDTSQKDWNMWWIPVEAVPLLLTTGQKCQQCLAVLNIGVSPYPLYLLNLAPCHFLFLRMKSQL